MFTGTLKGWVSDLLVCIGNLFKQLKAELPLFLKVASLSVFFGNRVIVLKGACKSVDKEQKHGGLHPIILLLIGVSGRVPLYSSVGC